MLDISNAVHSRYFSALTMFPLAGYPSKPIVCPTGRPGIHQEQLCHLWRSGFRDYLCPDMTFGYRLEEVPGKIKLTIVKRRISVTKGFSYSSCIFRDSVVFPIVCLWLTGI